MAHIRLGGLIFFFMRLILDQREGGERVGGECGRKLGRSRRGCRPAGLIWVVGREIGTFGPWGAV